MIPGEQPLQPSEQKAISRAARLCAQYEATPARRETGGASVAANHHRRIPLGRRTRVTGSVSLEQRLVTLFMD